MYNLNTIYLIVYPHMCNYYFIITKFLFVYISMKFLLMKYINIIIIINYL